MIWLVELTLLVALLWVAAIVFAFLAVFLVGRRLRGKPVRMHGRDWGGK